MHIHMHTHTHTHTHTHSHTNRHTHRCEQDMCVAVRVMHCIIQHTDAANKRLHNVSRYQKLVYKLADYIVATN